MLLTRQRLLTFNINTAYFCDEPFDMADCDAVYFVACKNKVEAEGFIGKENVTAVIDLSQDLEAIWQKMDKKSTRYEIKRAEKEGIKIDINRQHEEFYEIYKNLKRSKGFDSILGVGNMKPEIMKRHGTLFIAEHEGEILGGHLYLEDESHIRMGPSASRRLEVDKEKAALIGRANRLLHWEAIKYAKEKGISEFDWGGLWAPEGGHKDDGRLAVNSFKLSFGGQVVTRYSYQRTYSRIYRLGQYLYRRANNLLK